MSKKFVFALKASWASDAAGEGESASLAVLLHALDGTITFTERLNGVATAVFDDYESVEQLIQRAYDRYARGAEGSPEKALQSLDMLLLAGDDVVSVVQRLEPVIARRRRASQVADYPVCVYVDEAVYEELPPRFRDLYQSPQNMASNFAACARFSEDMQRCFVVSPIGPDDGTIRRRADFVFDRFVKAACGSTPFKPVRADMMLGSHILPEMFAALRRDPLVIVYLGASTPAWNPNVMFELGFRMGVDAPYIVLADAEPAGEENDLPFDLQDDRVVWIPPTETEDFDANARVIRQLRDRISDFENPSRQDSVYPGATIRIGAGADGHREATFTDASPDLESLIDLPRIVGRSVQEVAEHICRRMSPEQGRAFLEEQQRLLFQLLNPGLLSTGPPRATVPIRFSDHGRHHEEAFLPVVTHCWSSSSEALMTLNLIYMDVTSAVKEDSERGCFLSRLAAQDRRSVGEAGFVDPGGA
ncbi:MAG TPA: hypothetical protein PK440_19150 [Candidatus Accumulibacter phosphatis]|nr:MAG: hypothetical protein AW07_01273 [Candidatus Accumulibacter sp. SK-11]HAY29449.1 hypothetical protein [Accumulibacter sp.]HRL78177.1 hypothetical protein [Candidatus Accumulibacter phosphatis]HCN69797.1 hypothetical protein [Accumulibacter sp.]HCV13834.1 hypothetical protein [Accumulibacter sp.]